MTELEIIDTQLGTGTEALKGALISCHYTGLLEDGTKFDSSLDRGRPIEFVLGAKRVIQGWDLGLIGMKEGGKRTLRIPSKLAYGERQMGDIIKPHANLIFHIEMVEVKNRE